MCFISFSMILSDGFWAIFHHLWTYDTCGCITFKFTNLFFNNSKRWWKSLLKFNQIHSLLLLTLNFLKPSILSLYDVRLKNWLKRKFVLYITEKKKTNKLSNLSEILIVIIYKIKFVKNYSSLTLLTSSFSSRELFKLSS